MTDRPADEIPIPALLRAARGTYAAAIAGQLASAGIDDLPRHGAFVLGGMAGRGAMAADLIDGLGIGRQQAAQLVDTLVTRGYLTREESPGDRRRGTLALTDRGRLAAAEIRAAIEDIDDELGRRLAPDQLIGLRAGLFALAQIKREQRDAR